MGSRRFFAVVLAACLISLGWVSAPGADAQGDPVAEPSGTATSPEPGAPVEAGDPVEAEDLVSGVELVGERTETTETFATEEAGVFRTDVYAEPVNFEDPATGEMVDIDPAFVESGGGVETAATPVGVEIATDADAGVVAEVSFEDGSSAGFGIDGAAGVAGEVEGSSVTFEDVAVASSVVLEATAFGVKETIILEGPEAPTVWRFPLELDGLVAVVEAGSGDVLLVPAGGGAGAEPVGVIPHGWMGDASYETGERSPEVSYSEGVAYTLEETDGEQVLVVTLDEAWLGDPDRRWPVVVDPTLTQVDAGADDTWVTPYVTTNNRYFLGYWYAGSLGWFVNEAYVHLDASAVAGKVVHHAEFKAYQSAGSTCTETATELFEVAGSWNGNGLVWTNQPGLVSPAATRAMSGMGATGCTAGEWVTWGVTGLVRGWAAGTVTNHGIGLRPPAGQGVNPDYFKRFDAGSATYTPPHLQVIWSQPTATGTPDAPTNVAPAGIIGEQLPTLSATYVDPENDDGQVVFVAYDDTTNEQLAMFPGSMVASGEVSEFTLTTGMEAAFDTAYRIEAHAIDTNDHWSLTSTTTTFTVSSVALEPADGDVVFDVETLVATGLAGYTIDEVDFYVDDALVGTDDNPTGGWTTTWDTTVLDEESMHEVRAAATDTASVEHPSPTSTVLVRNLLTDVDRIQTDFDAGRITLDEWAIETTLAVLNNDGLAARYQAPGAGGPISEDHVGHSATLLEVTRWQWDNLSGSAQATIDGLRATPALPTGIPFPSHEACTGASGDEYPDDGVWCFWHAEIPDLPDAWFLWRPASHPDTDDRLPDYTDGSDSGQVPDWIEDQAVVLEAALETYEAAGYGIPGHDIDVVVEDQGIDVFGRETLGVTDIGSSEPTMRLDPQATPQVVAHEGYHIAQGDYVDTGPPSNDACVRKWVNESTAEWAPTFYANLPSSPLAGHDVGDHLVIRPTFWAQTFDPLEYGVRRGVDFGATNPCGVNDLSNGESAGNPSQDPEDYEAAIWWQYLSEQFSEPTLGGDDIVLDYWQAHASTPNAGDIGPMGVLADLAAIDAVGLDTVIRDFWVAAHLLTPINTATPQFNWTGTGTDAGEWRETLRDFGSSSVQADSFGGQRLASADVAIDAGGSMQSVLDLHPGGARVLDITPEPGHAGTLEVTVNRSAGEQVAVTALAYNAGGHPYVCSRGTPPEMVAVVEQWDVDTSDDTHTIEIDPYCPTASVVVVNTAPHRGDNSAFPDIEISFTDTARVLDVGLYGSEGTQPASGWLTPSEQVVIYPSGLSCLRVVFWAQVGESVSGGSAVKGRAYANGVLVDDEFHWGAANTEVHFALEIPVSSGPGITTDVVGWVGTEVFAHGYDTTECAP